MSSLEIEKGGRKVREVNMYIPTKTPQAIQRVVWLFALGFAL